MKNSTLFLYFFICIQTAFSQEKVASFNPNNNESKSVFTIVNEPTKTATLFYIDKKSITSFQFNDELILKDTLHIDYSNKELVDILGYSNSNNKYYLYWNTKKDDEIVTQCFDFEGNKVISSNAVFDIGKEKVIDKITVNNIFYVVTVLKNTSVLNFYCFSEGKIFKKTIDCSEYKFVDNENNEVTFWKLYDEFSETVYYNGITNILQETPASLVMSTAKKKAYIYNNSLIFTFDANRAFTQTLTINLSDFTPSQKSYRLPFIQKTAYNIIDSNSFFINGNFIQIKMDPSVFYITVKDIEGKEIKNLVLYPDKEIEFKNSDILQENGGIKSTRVLDTSNQFLKKTNNLNSSVSCYYNNETYNLVLGGVSYPQQTVNYGGMFGLIGSLIGSAIIANFSISNVNSYANKKVVYINCLFDKNFNHLNRYATKLAFDKLRLFNEENDKLINQTIFKLNSVLYMGGYKKETKEYTFYKFED